MPDTNRQLRLKSRPAGAVSRDNFEMTASPIPEVREGQALARVRYLSVDPTMRIWMSEREGYMPPVAIGEVMRSFGLAEVVASRSPQFKKGDKLVGFTGLQDYVVVDGQEARAFHKIPSIPFVSDSAFLGVLGINGLTAYFGMMDIAKPQKGETLVVSAAAGATGSIAGQIGKNHGCRVVGVAGSDEKCRWITDDLGFDSAVNYKHPDWKEKLAAATPKGIDINFENVGGEVMQAILSRMNLFGRVVLCGLISGYNKEDPGLASFATVLIKRLRVQGFILLDYASRFEEAGMELGKWLMMRRLKHRETIVEGLERAPDAINMLFTGDNIGKLLVRF